MKTFYFSILLLFITCLSCGHHTASPAVALLPDSTLSLRYAQGFRVDYFSGYKKVTVFNPWKPQDVQACYYVVQQAGTITPAPAQTVIAPLKSLAATASSHYAFIDALNELPSLTGVASPKLIYNEKLLKQCQSRHTIDLGDPFSLNIEKTLMLHPQALMMSSYNQTDPSAERVGKAGIPVVFNNEWMEKTPLGRAEWIKFVAAFYNRESVANAIFSSIEKNYLAMQALASKAAEKPSALIGNNFQGTWYMPSGKGFMGNILADAHYTYHFSADTTTGSIPLSFEQALHDFSNADIWLNSEANSLDEMAKNDSRYILFKSFRTGDVYSLAKRVNATGSNDFWESGVVHPDLILADYIKIGHPQLLPKYELVYLKKLGK